MPRLYKVTPSRPVFNALFFGDPGSGKTTLAASAQDSDDMRDVMFLNIEGGLLSISHRQDIVAQNIKTVSEIWEVFWELANKNEKYAGIKTVVVDSITELQTINLEEIVKAAVDRGQTSRSGKERTLNDIWQEDYGESTSELKRLVRGFKDLRVNVILTALAKYVYPKTSMNAATNPNAEPIAVMPMLTAKLGESIMGYMDFVWYTYYDSEMDAETEAERYRVLTRSRGAYKAKTRGPRFLEAIGDELVDPSLKDIYQTFVNSSTGTPAPVATAKPAKRKRAKTG